MQARNAAIPIYILLLSILVMTLTPPSTYSYSLDETRHVTIVAVSQLSNGSYIGVSADLYVRVTCPGSGHVYVETLPLSQIDLQASTRVAALVASSVANMSFYSCDFYASIKSDSPIIGGPSASGVTAVAFAAALLRLPLNESIIMTGMIMPDGSVGPVGGLKYKLDAAASRGAKVFIVPFGQTRDTIYKVVAQRVGPTIITRVVPETVDLISYGAQLNVLVIPVANIYEALEIFTDKIYRVPPRDMGWLDRFSDIYASLNTIQREWISNLSSEISRALNESRAIEDRALSTLRGYSGIYIRNLLQNIDSSIEGLRRQAEALESAGKLYAAASIYLQALIYAYQRLHLLKAIIDGSYISQEVGAVNSSVYGVIEYVNRYSAENGIDVARLSIAINTLDRAYEALVYVNRTLSSQYVDSASQYLALASARVYTARLWSTLLSSPIYNRARGPQISADDLNRMAIYISALAQNIYTYIVAFSSSTQISNDILSDAVYRYSLLFKVSEPLDKLALGISSISYMHLALVSIFLQDYNSTIEALNRTIGIALSSPTSLDTPPIDVPLYIEMVKAFTSYPQTQIAMLSRLSIILSIYRILATEISQQPYPSETEVEKITETIRERETVTVTTTTTITTTVTVTQQPQTITVTTTMVSTVGGSRLEVRDIILVAAIAILLVIAVAWLMIRRELTTS